MTTTTGDRRIFCPACEQAMDVTGDVSQGLECPACKTGFVPEKTYPVPPISMEVSPQRSDTSGGEKVTGYGTGICVLGFCVILLAGFLALRDETSWGTLWFGCGCMALSFMMGIIGLLMQIRDRLPKK